MELNELEFKCHHQLFMLELALHLIAINEHGCIFEPASLESGNGEPIRGTCIFLIQPLH